MTLPADRVELTLGDKTIAITEAYEIRASIWLSCTFSGFAAQQIVGKLPTFPGAGKGRQGAG
jgi:hypothetical protein